jgi:hypothetical protein
MGSSSPLLTFPRNCCQDYLLTSIRYTPNFALCILAIVLFALALLCHTLQLIKHRTWYFLPVALAGAMEVIGYIFRSFSSRKDPYSIIYFVVQYFFIIVAPVFISASIYVCLSKVIQWAVVEGFHLGPFQGRQKIILWVFVTFDVVTTIAQIVGAALIGSAESSSRSPKVPNHIVLGGLAVQTFAFTVFLVLFGILIATLWREKDLRPRLRSIGQFIVALEVASILVYLRTNFRLAETSQGVFGYLSRHEAFFGSLEFAPIVCAIVILAVWHPGRYFLRRAQDGGDVEKTKKWRKFRRGRQGVVESG